MSDGALWMPLAVLDSPERFPCVPINPGLADDWPVLRESVL